MGETCLCLWVVCVCLVVCMSLKYRELLLSFLKGTFKNKNILGNHRNLVIALNLWSECDKAKVDGILL